MERSKPCAVAVFRSPDIARNIAGMLLEYDVSFANDGLCALEICRAAPVELVVAEAVLPGIDGYGLAERLRRLDAVTRPGVVVISPPGMLRRMDADGCKVVTSAANADEILVAADRVRLENRAVPGEFAIRVGALLNSLGIPDHCGREYLMDAVFLNCEDRRMANRLTKKLYPMVAKRRGVSPQAVERAMRRVIETAWNRGSIDAQYEIFKDTIDAAKGKPTCGGMIAQLSEILRMEG